MIIDINSQLLYFICRIFGHRWRKKILYTEYCKRCGAARRGYGKWGRSTFPNQKTCPIIYKIEKPHNIRKVKRELHKGMKLVRGNQKQDKI